MESVGKNIVELGKENSVVGNYLVMSSRPDTIVATSSLLFFPQIFPEPFGSTCLMVFKAA